MTLNIELDENAEIVHILVDNHLSLTAEKRDRNHIVFQNFDALVDDDAYEAMRSVATALLNLTND